MHRSHRAKPVGLLYDNDLTYNPNNVALEASPISTIAEMEVGEQMCDMFGFNNHPKSKNEPKGWAHITSGGTVANLESLWVGRSTCSVLPRSMQS